MHAGQLLVCCRIVYLYPMRYLDPKNDLIFKKIFGQHPHLLRSFLNALLPLNEDQQIVSLEYLPTEMVPEIPGLKNSIVDVRCRDTQGRQFLVEMQMLWTQGFKQRVLFNASKAYVKQMEEAEKYEGLQPVYALSLVNTTFDEAPEYYHHYMLYHSEYPNKRIEGIELVFIELPKFKAKNITEKKLSVLWLRYLTEMGETVDEPAPELAAVPEINEAIEHSRVSAFSRQELDSYDRYWDIIRTNKTLEHGFRTEGFAKGHEAGHEAGLEEGREIGLTDAMVILQAYREGATIPELVQRFSFDEAKITELLRSAGLLKG